MNKPDASTASATLSKEFVVRNKLGIHARPAAMIVRITNKFKADVFVDHDRERREISVGNQADAGDVVGQQRVRTDRDEMAVGAPLTQVTEGDCAAAARLVDHR